MAEFITRQIKLGLSKTAESAYNTPVTGGSNFWGAISTTAGFGIPQLEKLDDLNKVGTGHEFATYLRNNYWSHSQVQLGDELNTDQAVVLLARAFGGDITTAAATGETGEDLFVHDIEIQSGTSRQLPSSTVVTSVGRLDSSHQGASFIYPGMVVDSIQIQQDSQAAVPQFTADLVGSGKYTQTDATIAAIPDTAFQHYIHGAAVSITFNDGTAIDLTDPADQRVRSWSFSYNNNLRRDDRRPGDPFRVTGDPFSGAYVNRLLRGARSCQAMLTVSLNEDLREFITHRDNVIITSLTITMLGELNGTAQHELTIVLPKSYMRAVTPSTDNDDSTLQLEIFPVKGSGEYVTAHAVSAIEDLV